MSFAWPWCFLLALPLIAAAWRMFRRGRRVGVRFPAIANLPKTGRTWRTMLAAAAPYMYLAALALMVVAAARPQTENARSKKSTDSIAIAMTVDISGSMENPDMTPKGLIGKREMTRLDIVKDLFAEFVKKRPDDLISLVTFGGYASCRTPLTTDHDAVLHVLKGVEIPGSRYDRTGSAVDGTERLTAIGDGILAALARVKDAAVKSKIVILLSDGMQEMPESADPDEAARAAAAFGVKVYTIGVGTKTQVTDFFGNTRIVGFDESQLKSIAKITGGTYFAVNDKDALEKALEEIDKLEKTTIETAAYSRKYEHFAPFLTAGALLAFLAVALQMAATRRIV